MAQQLAELRDHSLRGTRVSVHLLRDRVERIEQKVRLQLHLEQSELRSRELRLERGRTELLLAIHALVRERDANGENGPVREDVQTEARREPLWVRPQR